MAKSFLPRRSVNAPSHPPIITLPLGDRHQIELAIEALLAVLDQRDGDPDLECNGDPEDQSEDEGAQCDDEGFGR
jgi:hypothetical protein